MRRPVLLCLSVLVLCAAGCGADAVEGSATPAAGASSGTTSPAPDEVPVEDQELAAALYDGWTTASAGGLEPTATYMSEHNHPELPYTPQECADSLRSSGLPEDLQLAAVADLDSMEPSPGWEMPTGRYAGTAPSGTLYVLDIAYTETEPTTGSERTSTQTVHVAVLDGEARFFQECEDLG